jgi:hypothetical protein
VAQTIVPVLSPPVISANSSVGGVMVVAAGRSTFRLTDALSVAENASSSAALEAYHRRKAFAIFSVRLCLRFCALLGGARRPQRLLALLLMPSSDRW